MTPILTPASPLSIETNYSAAEVADYLSRGGDRLADILGNVIAAVIRDDQETLERITEPVLDAILRWHQLRAEVHPR